MRISSLAVLVGFLCLTAAAQGQSPRVYRARVDLRGAPGSNVAGVVHLTQYREGAVTHVEVEAVFTGLQPGARHGIHIHEAGNCGNTDPRTGETGNFLGAGGHYDPGPASSPAPVDENHPYHSGDLPNVEVNELGVGRLVHHTSRITLQPGPLTVFDPDNPNTSFDDTDSTIILHVNEDRYEPGVTGASGGARLACGIINRVSGFEAGGTAGASSSPAVKAHAHGPRPSRVGGTGTRRSGPDQRASVRQ